MSQNRNLLISEVGKTARLLLLSSAKNAETDGTSFFFEVRKNVTHLNNINLADVANQFADRKDSRKQTFRYFSQNYS